MYYSTAGFIYTMKIVHRQDGVVTILYLLSLWTSYLQSFQYFSHTNDKTEERKKAARNIVKPE